MQASPGHMLFIACVFTLFHVTQWAEAEPPLLIKQRDEAAAAPKEPQGRSTLAHGMLQPSLSPSPRQHKDPAPATELCTLPFPADGSTWCQKKSRAHYKPQLGPCVSDSYLYRTQVYGFSFAATKSGLGKKNARTFHWQVSWNNNLLKKDFEM